MKPSIRLKSWQWFVLLYLGGLIGISILAYGLRLLINGAL
jgi:hypothetical protein